jgi:nucleotide-binding universal stress UspA family protein
MNILIAVDRSDDANNALEFALRFPFPRDSNLTVLTVVDDIPLLQAEIDALNAEQSSQLEEAGRQLREEAEELLEEASKRLRKDDWAGSTMIRHGNPVEEILAVAREVDADLIVTGSHGTSIARHYLLGSVSERLLEVAPCSVLIVRPGEAEPEEIAPGRNAPFRILIAFDNSDISNDVIEGCACLPLEESSEIRVVSVMPLIPGYRQDIRQQIDSIWQQKKQIMQNELEKAVTTLQWSTPNVSAELREGDSVTDEILNAASEANSDLIVIGCKDKSVLRRFIYGSVTHRIARHAKCSVWSVRSKTH